MQINITGTLIGVVGKKGTGKLDNGETWSTDRVELHVVTPFASDDSMAHGSTVTVYNLPDYAKHYDNAKACLSQEINLNMEMQAAKKLGAAPKFVCMGFSPLKQHKVAAV